MLVAIATVSTLALYAAPAPPAPTTPAAVQPTAVRPPAAKPPASAVDLNAPLAPFLRFAADLERDLGAAIRGDVQAKARLSGRAADRARFTDELTRFLAAARKAGAAADGVHVTGAKVQATLWYGIFPVRDVEIYLWHTTPTVKLLRLTEAQRVTPMFGGRKVVTWTGAAARGLTATMARVIRAATGGRCEALPWATPADFEPVLPRDPEARRQVRYALDKARLVSPGHCARLVGLPVHKMTYRVGELGVTLTVADGSRRAFRLQLGARSASSGRLTLGHISLPAAPRKGPPKPRGAVYKLSPPAKRPGGDPRPMPFIARPLKPAAPKAAPPPPAPVPTHPPKSPTP